MNGDNQATAVKRNKDASFWKTNSDTVIKMLVHQFGLTVFGFLLNSAASVSGNDLLVIGLGLFSAVFYLFLLYVVAWELGAKDKIRIDGGRMKRDIFKGAKINLVANIPNLIVATLALVGFLFIDKSIMTEGAYTDPAWAVNLRGIAQLVGNFLNAMYLGIGEIENAREYLRLSLRLYAALWADEPERIEAKVEEMKAYLGQVNLQSIMS